MWTCKQVSNALARQDYEQLPLIKKLLLRFHVAMCVVCGKYNRQVMLMHDGARHFRKHEEELLDHDQAPCLSSDCKQAIKESLKKQDTPGSS